MTGPRGMCFHRSAAFVLDLPQATLVVGTIRAATPEEREENPDFSDVDFIHAWPEVGNLVFPPSWMKADGTMQAIDRDEYYEMHTPYDIHRMPRIELKKLSEEHGFARHFSRFTPLKNNVSFGDVILKALGVQYTITKDGGVIPASGGKNEPVSVPRVSG
jgi:hypothetical protein